MCRKSRLGPVVRNSLATTHGPWWRNGILTRIPARLIHQDLTPKATPTVEMSMLTDVCHTSICVRKQFKSLAEMACSSVRISHHGLWFSFPGRRSFSTGRSCCLEDHRLVTGLAFFSFFIPFYLFDHLSQMK